MRLSMTVRQRCVAAMACALAVAAIPGCGGTDHREGAPTPDARDKLVPPALHPVLSGTIGSFANLSSDHPQPVEAYGIVAGLPNTGSGDMPPELRQRMFDMLVREGLAGSPTQGTEHLDPQKILSSREVALVVVRGVIPPLAPKRTYFDLQVTAYPNTQTTSLEHGLLWTTELRVSARLDASSRPIAHGRGPVFCNPFNKKLGDPVKAQASVRSGRVLAGGITTEDMPVILTLYTPSYSKTNLIQRAVNGRFPVSPGDPPYATVSENRGDSVVQLRIPKDYHDNPRDFVDLVMHMYLAQDVPSFTDQKAYDILKLMRSSAKTGARAATTAPATQSDIPWEDLSLALEGLGRVVLPQLRACYTDPDPKVRYWTARAGAAMSDVEAMVVLHDFAMSDGSEFQFRAVQAIARKNDQKSQLLLGKMLSSENLKLRVAAYEALLGMKSDLIDTRVAGDGKFCVDVVPAKGAPIIYATQHGFPRIALIGDKFEVPRGVVYVSPDTLLTINRPDIDDPAATQAAVEMLRGPATQKAGRRESLEKYGSGPVQIYYRGIWGDQQVLKFSSSNLRRLLFRLAYVPDPRSEDYNPSEQYIGASYQRVVEMLYLMCKDHRLAPTFVLQQTPESNRSLPALTQPRPEVDTTQPATQP